MLWMEAAPGDQAVRRAGAGQPGWPDPLFVIPEERVSVKAGCGKTARPVWVADEGQRNRSRVFSDPTIIPGRYHSIQVLGVVDDILTDISPRRSPCVTACDSLEAIP